MEYKYEFYMNINRNIISALRKIICKELRQEKIIINITLDSIVLYITKSHEYRNILKICKKSVNNFQSKFCDVIFDASLLLKRKNNYKLYTYNKDELHKHINKTEIFINDITKIILDYTFETKMYVCEKNKIFETTYHYAIKPYIYSNNENKIIHMHDIDKSDVISLLEKNKIAKIKLFDNIATLQSHRDEEHAACQLIRCGNMSKKAINRPRVYYASFPTNGIIEQIRKMQTDKIDIYVYVNRCVFFECKFNSNIKITVVTNV